MFITDSITDHKYKLICEGLAVSRWGDNWERIYYGKFLERILCSLIYSCFVSKVLSLSFCELSRNRMKETPSLNEIIDAENKIYCCKDFLSIQHVPTQKKWILTSWRKFYCSRKNYSYYSIKITIILLKR